MDKNWSLFLTANSLGYQYKKFQIFKMFGGWMFAPKVIKIKQKTQSSLMTDVKYSEPPFIQVVCYLFLGIIDNWVLGHI